MKRITYLAAVPVLVLSAAAPAVAEQTVHDDPAGDVIEYEEFPEPQEVVVPGDRKRDITSIKTTYGDQKLVVTIDLRNLATDYTLSTRITTSEGSHFIVHNHDQAGTEQDSLNLFPVMNPRAVWGGGEPVDCPGLDVARLFEKDRIRTTIPRGCISAPARVRTGALMRTNLDETHSRLDDARRNADVPDETAQTRLGSSVSYN